LQAKVAEKFSDQPTIIKSPRKQQRKTREGSEDPESISGGSEDISGTFEGLRAAEEQYLKRE
jgi:hypothetical protein